MIVTLIPDVKNYDLNVITDDKQRIHLTGKPGGAIIIFLKKHHYTCAVFDRERDEIVYFDPYGDKNEKRREEDLPQLK